MSEYVRMFDLTEDDLGKRILGCGDGPASFNAEMFRLGNSVISVDPIYRFSRTELKSRIVEVFPTMIAKAEEKYDAFVWDYLRSPEHLGQVRMEAMNAFLGDLSDEKSQRRYIDAELPDLPFDDNAFELALCSHYLFTYSDLIDEDQHVVAIVEMCRVATDVRVFPIVDMFDGGRSLHVDGVIDRLNASGYRVIIRQVPYEFQRGGNQMLQVTHDQPR